MQYQLEFKYRVDYPATYILFLIINNVNHLSHTYGINLLLIEVIDLSFFPFNSLAVPL